MRRCASVLWLLINSQTPRIAPRLPLFLQPCLKRHRPMRRSMLVAFPMVSRAPARLFRCRVWRARKAGWLRRERRKEVASAEEIPPRLVHDRHGRRLEPGLFGQRQSVGRRVLCRHGEGDGARLLRLHHARRHVDDRHAYGDSTEAYLKYALMGPKMDPAPQAALIGAATKNMGVVATFSTMAYPPFMLARLCTTLDHICTGRFGWNIVTSGENHA